MLKTIVIALGGNAMIQHDQRGTIEEQKENIEATCDEIAKLAGDHRIVITHGNGPQVGNILIQQEGAKVPKMPLDVCGAKSQGQIGYLIQQTLANRLEDKGSVVAVVTQVLVDRNDEAFRRPTKPVGPFYKTQDSLNGKDYIEVPNKGYRRVVPSPIPIDIIEKRSIRELVGMGIVVISCGGGGIPVVNEGGELVGVEAVIDKDLAGELLAQIVDADLFVILTDVDKVCINYGKDGEKALDHMSLEDAKRYHTAGQFPPGSMGPKMQAAINFIENGGEAVVITSIKLLREAIKGQAGTYITR